MSAETRDDVFEVCKGCYRGETTESVTTSATEVDRTTDWTLNLGGDLIPRGVEFTEIDRDDFRSLLEEIGRMYMPFGMFGPKEYPPAGVPIIDLPPEYLAWFKERGFPKGRLGELMEMVFEVKQTGADGVFAPIRQKNGGRFKLQKKRKRSVTFEDDSDE